MLVQRGSTSATGKKFDQIAASVAPPMAIRRADGKLRFVSATASPLPPADDGRRSVVVCFSDVSAEQGAAERLRLSERLLAAGVAEDELSRISAPVGLDLGATAARETAVSIMAELVAVRHGRSGGRLSQSKGGGRIHKVAAS